jgi:hypothetical protein
MWTVSGQVAALNMAFHGDTLTSFPSRSVNPCGLFIHSFAHTTKNADKTAATKIGTPHSKWVRGLSRSQP